MSTYIYLFITVFIGAFLGRWLRQSKVIPIKMLLIFSGAYLLGIGVFHLLPEIYDTHSHHYGLLIMAGFFVQLLLEAMSKGLEHGHSHTELFHNKGLPVGVLIGLFLHAFIESIPVGSHMHHVSKDALLWGLIVHKLPVSIILYSMLSEFSSKWYVVFAWMLAFALMAPLGVLLGEAVPFFANHASELTAFVFGIFLHISTTILFEGDHSHRFNFLKYGVILLALAIAWLSVSH